jgi:hypothetical protein
MSVLRAFLLACIVLALCIAAAFIVGAVLSLLPAAVALPLILVALLAEFTAIFWYASR